MKNQRKKVAASIGRKRMRTTGITHLFLDVGGVLLTNGWDLSARESAATAFNFNLKEMEDRHRLVCEAFTDGNLSLEKYLSRVVFYRKRTFTRERFRCFMLAQSKPYPEMIMLVSRLKARYGLKIVVVNNEARELNDYRISKFKLTDFADLFISSCYIHLHKPNKEIYRLALNISQADPRRVVYIENTLKFVKIGEEMGIKSILHRNYSSTKAKLVQLGLKVDHA